MAKLATPTPTRHSAGEPTRDHVLATVLLIALPAFGIALFFPEIVLTGFRQVPGNLGDTRLVNYFLEHTWLWVCQKGNHTDFWNLPMFYPTPNVTAFSENMLGGAPLYWFFRGVRMPIVLAFQVWLIACVLLDYIAAAFMLRSAFRLSLGASACGAALYAFGGPRATYRYHPQLLPHFFAPLAVWAIARILREEERRRRVLPWVFVAAAVSLQLWANLYLGWFLAFCIAIATVVAVGLPSARPIALLRLRHDAKAIGLALVLAGILLAPLLIHYRLAATQHLPSPFDLSIQRIMIPPPQSWIFSGSYSRVYGWEDRFFEMGLPLPTLGLGVVTTALVIFGLWTRRKSTAHVIIGLSMVILMALCTRFGDHSLWNLLRPAIPGAASIRAVFRVGVAMLLPASILAASAFSKSGSRPLWAIIASLIIVVEQASRPAATYAAADERRRAEWLASKISVGCSSFFFTVPLDAGEPAPGPWRYHSDAIMAEALTGVPTLNGYSGYFPTGYELYNNGTTTQGQHETVLNNLRQWVAAHHVQYPCVIFARPPSD
jgi:hypothetical protein